MSAIDWVAVVAWAPQLAGMPLEVQTTTLDYVNAELPVLAFDGGEDSPKLRYARIMLACHIGETWNKQGVGGAQTSETVSATSVSTGWAAPFHGSISSLETTSYGLEYQRIIDSTTWFHLPMVP